MPNRVTIISRKPVFTQAIFRVEEITFCYETYAGQMSAPVTRLSLERGDSVAAVVHETDRDMLIFTEQFRIGTYTKGPGWLLELPAGTVEPGEEPERAMRRELAEEIGYAVTSLAPISTFYVSPGGTSERIILYYAKVSPIQRVSAGGGLAAEGENIRVVRLTIAEALRQMERGEIADAKTIIGLQWLKQPPISTIP
jgi:ADP-ribose pyrophosphatase